MDSDFINEQIQINLVLLKGYQDALLFLSKNPNRSYSFDTGQSKETVTQKDITQVHRLIRSLTEDVMYWQDMLNGAVIGRPGF